MAAANYSLVWNIIWTTYIPHALEMAATKSVSLMDARVLSIMGYLVPSIIADLLGASAGADSVHGSLECHQMDLAHATAFKKMRKPSPRSLAGSLVHRGCCDQRTKRSGCGISAKIRPESSQMPAISSIEPFGL